MKLWGGRFAGEADSTFARFQSSFWFDKRLFEADVAGSIAYANALGAAQVLSGDEVRLIVGGLQALRSSAAGDAQYLAGDGFEDVHSFVEARLVGEIGETGYKLHTGRSRNDQVATDLRLFLRQEIDLTLDLLTRLQQAVVDLASAHSGAILPGYTHLQRAQPILFAHFALAYFEMFGRDRLRLAQLRTRVNQMPLGSGALAGAGFDIDRAALAAALGFEGVCRNSVDAVSDRDFVIEYTGACAIVMVHLSRLAEDFILYSSSEFRFIELSDAVSTGSSIMPQKKNPDSLELIRGKSGRVFGHHAGLLATMKGLPLAYNKDMQEDKEALFDTIDTVHGSLLLMSTVLRNLIVHEDRMAAAAAADYTNATDAADYLVRHGLPFRVAHEIVGRLVTHAISQGKDLGQLSLEEYQRFSPLFGDDIFESVSIEASLASRRVAGGTARARVSEALARARRELGLPPDNPQQAGV